METAQAACDARITANMIDSMRFTKPWTRILSIIGFITVGLMVGFSLFMIFAGSIFMGAQAGVPTAMMGIMYLLMALIYLFPSIYLFKYSSAIGRLLISRKEAEMEAALLYQKSFWKFLGILTIVMVGVAILGIIAAIVIPMVIGLRSAHSG